MSKRQLTAVNPFAKKSRGMAAVEAAGKGVRTTLPKPAPVTVPFAARTPTKPQTMVSNSASKLKAILQRDDRAEKQVTDQNAQSTPPSSPAHPAAGISTPEFSRHRGMGLYQPLPQPAPPPSKFQGLPNLGNTCYINSVLQVLSNLEPFVGDLLQPKLATLLREHQDDAQVYGALFRAVCGKHRGQTVGKFRSWYTSGPAEVKRALEKNKESFAGTQQQDAHEFLCSMLELLEAELQPHLPQGAPALGSSGSAKDPAVVSGEPPQPSAAAAAASDTPDLHSAASSSLCPVGRNFSCVIENTFNCLNCGATSKVLEQFSHLSIDIPDSRSRGGPPLPTSTAADLTALLARYFQEEVIEHKCSECEERNCVVSHEIAALPRVLVLHLKRFVAPPPPPNFVPTPALPPSASRPAFTPAAGPSTSSIHGSGQAAAPPQASLRSFLSPPPASKLCDPVQFPARLSLDRFTREDVHMPESPRAPDPALAPEPPLPSSPAPNPANWSSPALQQASSPPPNPPTATPHGAPRAWDNAGMHARGSALERLDPPAPGAASPARSPVCASDNEPVLTPPPQPSKARASASGSAAVHTPPPTSAEVRELRYRRSPLHTSPRLSTPIMNLFPSREQSVASPPAPSTRPPMASAHTASPSTSRARYEAPSMLRRQYPRQYARRSITPASAAHMAPRTTGMVESPGTSHFKSSLERLDCTSSHPQSSQGLQSDWVESSGVNPEGNKTEEELLELAIQASLRDMDHDHPPPAGKKRCLIHAETAENRGLVNTSVAATPVADGGKREQEEVDLQRAINASMADSLLTPVDKYQAHCEEQENMEVAIALSLAEAGHAPAPAAAAPPGSCPASPSRAGSEYRIGAGYSSDEDALIEIDSGDSGKRARQRTVDMSSSDDEILHAEAKVPSEEEPRERAARHQALISRRAAQAAEDIYTWRASPERGGPRRAAGAAGPPRGRCPPPLPMAKAALAELDDDDDDEPSSPCRAAPAEPAFARSPDHNQDADTTIPGTLDKEGVGVYDLHGVIGHLGKFASSGHYIADIYDAAGKQWMRHNDSIVEPVRVADVFGAAKQCDAYMLVYVLQEETPDKQPNEGKTSQP